ncbi:hypothetical protein PIB30_088673 [Stylosanthes scabra]|uniref:Ubiquitin-like protease family profile domain-containing protein n=1 Tax=Stylosanthes scabra TaxID=79078 RepID=A0ABU6WTQ0_9FABA|nr:hypothetical protein [Stylosanthes scabra]
MIIYFHETQFGENSRDPAAQPPWLAYWTGENLKKRIKQERQHDVGLLKTGQLRAEKEQLKKKSTKRVPSSDSESQTEPEPPYSNSTDGEGDSMSDSDETISEQPPQQKEIRSKRRFDHAVVGSNAPLNPTQESSAFAGLPDPDNVSLADALKNLRKRKKEAMEIKKPKKRSAKGNETDETMHDVLRSAFDAVVGSSDRTRMFDSFDTVILGRDDITATQPSQPSKPGNEPEREDPLPEDPEPCSLTLREWLQPEAKGCAAKGLMDSRDVGITDVLLSMNQGGPGSTAQPTNDDNLDLGEQFRNPDPLQQQGPTAEELEARCTSWATLDNDNKYDTIFQIRGPRTIEALRYNFMTMRPATCIDIQMVSIVCHVLNREPVERFESDVYCVPPEILTGMFNTYGLNYLDKKTKMPYLVKQLKDHEEYVQLLDMEKLKSHSVLFAPALYSSHWSLYVLDVQHKEFYIVDSVYG